MNNPHDNKCVCVPQRYDACRTFVHHTCTAQVQRAQRPRQIIFAFCSPRAYNGFKGVPGRSPTEKTFMLKPAAGARELPPGYPNLFFLAHVLNDKNSLPPIVQELTEAIYAKVWLRARPPLVATASSEDFQHSCNDFRRNLQVVEDFCRSTPHTPCPAPDRFRAEVGVRFMNAGAELGRLRQCSWCGTWFVAQMENSKYCAERCRFKAHTEDSKARANASRRTREGRDKRNAYMRTYRESHPNAR